MSRRRNRGRNRSKTRKPEATASVLDAADAHLAAEIDADVLSPSREPSVVDRVGSLGCPKLAQRVQVWDDRLARLVDLSNEVYKRTVRAQNNWVYTTDPAIARIIDPTGEHTTEVAE